MDKSPQNERRKYHRLQYPESERPTVRINGQDFHVSEISEKGTRILIPNSCPLSHNDPVTGVLWFQDGVNIVIHGVVQRCDEHGMALKLSKGISMQRMIIEQSRLLEKYPTLLDAPENEIDNNPA